MNRCARPALVLVATWVALFCSPLVRSAGGGLDIVISEGHLGATPVAVVPFAWDGPGQAPEDIAAIVRFDFARSGQLAPLAVENMLSYPTRPEEVYFRDWRVQKIEYVLIGRLVPEANPDSAGAVARVRIRYQLFDVFQQKQLAESEILAIPSRLRDAAHQISDQVYEYITGLQGAYSTRLAYVLARNVAVRGQESYALVVADVDGARPRILKESRQPMLSVSWSPDGRSLAYASAEDGWGVWMMDLKSGRQERLTRFPRINSAPTFSPDGQRLAMVLSKDGNPEIYVMDLRSRQLSRITRNRAIDTEPGWTPDGNGLIFTSDRSSRPQIYRYNFADDLTDRLTFTGNYNARGRMLPDGRHLVFVHRVEGVYQIALLDLERDTTVALTRTALDESPSVAPNGTMMVYATMRRRQGILAVVSTDGSVKYQLPSADGDVREPAWSPRLDVGSLLEP